MASEKTYLDAQRNSDRLPGRAVVALLFCFLTYLVGVYVLWPQEEQELVLHEPLPQDPPKPAEPLIWGPLPVSKPGPSSDKGERRLDGERTVAKITTMTSLIAIMSTTCRGPSLPMNFSQERIAQ